MRRRSSKKEVKRKRNRQEQEDWKNKDKNQGKEKAASLPLFLGFTVSFSLLFLSFSSCIVSSIGIIFLFCNLIFFYSSSLILHKCLKTGLDNVLNLVPRIQSQQQEMCCFPVREDIFQFSIISARKNNSQAVIWRVSSHLQAFVSLNSCLSSQRTPSFD